MLLLYQLLLLIATLVHGFVLVEGQACFGGVLTFEKSTGFSLNARPSQRLLPLSKSLALDCVESCREKETCAAFQTDYTANECQAFRRNAVSDSTLLEEKSTVNYFEKICLAGVNASYYNVMCASKMWAFEREQEATLDVPAVSTQRVSSKTECARLCFISREFTCRAANYDTKTGRCALLGEDRRTSPHAFRRGRTGWHYLENQCSVRLIQSCVYSTLADKVIARPDHVTYAPSRENCTAMCDQNNRFFCRSYAYNDDAKTCALSSGDEATSGSKYETQIGVVSGQRTCILLQCAGNSISYEKVIGHHIEEAIEELIEPIGDHFSTVTCLTACTNRGMSCPAVHVDYPSQRCFRLDRNAQSSNTALVSKEGYSYFEQMCLPGASRHCPGKVWAFERTPGHELAASPTDRIIRAVQNRRECESACLTAERFKCRSATYDGAATECRLSESSRRTHPQLFRRSGPGTDYLENQCTALDPGCRFMPVKDSLPRYTDMTATPVVSREECERACLTAANFTCRSAGFRPAASECRLSSDDDARDRHEGGTFLNLQCSRFSTGREGNRGCGKRTYERTSGAWLPRGNELASFPLLDRSAADDCRKHCDRNKSCSSFSVDFSTGRCFLASEEASLETRVSTSHFAAICLPEGARCDRLWAFNRIMDMELRGYDRNVYTDISKAECRNRCLKESRYHCRSVSYSRRTCRISDHDHTTRPDSFTRAIGNEYLVNECIERVNNIRIAEEVPRRLQRAADCQFVNRIVGQGLEFNDKLHEAKTEKECQNGCRSERTLNCRSYTFYNLGQTTSCYLSSETRQSMGARMRETDGAVYAELMCGNERNTDGTTSGGGITSLPQQSSTSEQEECGPDDFTFERIVGRIPRKSPQTPSGGVEGQELGTTALCLQNCKDAGTQCGGVAVHYSGGAPYTSPCSTFSRSAGIDLRAFETRADTAYFEKICVRGTKCGTSWTFERVPGYALLGFVSKHFQNIATREACMEKCLAEKTCRSAQFYPRAQMCHLSAETRRSHPIAFRFQGGDVQYMENQCATDPSSCNFVDLPNFFLPYADLVVPDVVNLSSCQQECGRSSSDFMCRSVSYDSRTNSCYVSACDRACNPTARNILIRKMGTTFSERSSCIPPQPPMPPYPRPPNYPYPPPPPPPHIIHRPPPPPPPPHPPIYPQPYPPPVPSYPTNVLQRTIQPRKTTECSFTYVRITGLGPQATNSSTMNVTSTVNCIETCNKMEAGCLAFLQELDDCLAFKDSPTEVTRFGSISFFRKTCLKGKMCTKLWAIDHQPGFELKGFNKRRVLNINTLDECSELCLSETAFVCKSANYDFVSHFCDLSSETRYSKPIHFQRASHDGINYLENQCDTT